MRSLTRSDAGALLANRAFLERLARRVGGEEADDLVQDTWVAALQRPSAWASIEGRGLRAWLASVLRRRAVSRLRSEGRRARREGACARPEGVADTAELVERVELQNQLVAAVISLPEHYRDVVLLCDLRGESVVRASARLGAPTATVRTRLRRAHELLRDRLRVQIGDDDTRLHSGLALLATGLGLSQAWTRDILMKKTLLQMPILVAGLLGAGVGIGGSLLLDDDDAARADGRTPAELDLVAPVSSDDDEEQAASDDDHAALAAARRPLAPPAATESEAPLLDALGPLEADDLRRLLASEDRLDQVRAIQLLLEEGSERSQQLLLDAFLQTTDPLLAGLLEEALFDSDLDLAPFLIQAYGASTDPARVAHLASMLAQIALERPALEADIIDVLVATFADPATTPSRGAVASALASIGVGALEAVAELFADPETDPEAAQSAAWVLTQIDGEHADLVRQRLGESYQALLGMPGEQELTAEELRALVARTQTLSWTASMRPHDEHDALAPMLLDHLLRATEPNLAQSVAWGLANLEGLSDDGRQSMAFQILEHLSEVGDEQLRQSQVWAVRHMAVFYDKPIDATFHTILARVRLGASDPRSSPQWAWLLYELEKLADG